MNKEFEFLKIIHNSLENNSYLGDDCAFLSDENLCVSSDTLIEDVHFSQLYMTPSEIAKKAMLVNISDILASGAKLKYATICLSGKLDNDFIEKFYSEINTLTKEYDFKIIGGDLTKSEKIVINITVFGSTKNKNISSRKNAKEGYIVAICGEFGSSAKGLEELQKGLKDSEFIKIHKSPNLYPKISEKIATTIKTPYAMMDSSDSLYDCLYQIAKASNVRIDIEYDKIPKKINDFEKVIYGGEDYCLVGCFNEEEIKNIKELIPIGKVSKGNNVFINNEKLDYKGYKHFE